MKTSLAKTTATLRSWIAIAFLALVAGCAASQDGASDASNAAVYEAWRNGRTRIEVTAHGAVAHILGQRTGPSGSHLGFLLHLTGSAGRGLTVRVEDNLDLTGPIVLHEGDDATIRGEYIYDARGGLIHYTHRDPRGRHAAGYVQVEGRLYQ